MKSQKAAFDEFVKVRDELIHPTLNEIGQQLETQGHRYEVVDYPIAINRLISTPYGAVSIRVFVGDFDWSQFERLGPFLKIPLIAFGFSLAERKVEVLVHPPSEGRINGNWVTRVTNRYEVEEITKEIIEREVSQFLNSIPLEP